MNVKEIKNDLLLLLLGAKIKTTFFLFLMFGFLWMAIDLMKRNPSKGAIISVTGFLIYSIFCIWDLFILFRLSYRLKIIDIDIMPIQDSYRAMLQISEMLESIATDTIKKKVCEIEQDIKTALVFHNI